MSRYRHTQAPPHRDTPRNPGDADSLGFQHRGKVMSRRLAFIGVICRQNHLANATILHPGHQALQSQLSRPKTIERGDSPHQHVIEPLKSQGLLHHVHVNRGFHDAQETRIAPRGGAALANLKLGKGIAALAVPNGCQRVQQGFAQMPSPLSISLQKVIRQTLRRFRADTRQAAQCLDQRLQSGGIHLERKLETGRKVQSGGKA